MLQVVLLTIFQFIEATLATYKNVDDLNRYVQQI